ncbi:DUF1992 domain-containing protein [Niallia sp. Krafla_26]|uniref:DnaJ family domain-containing protein n=1 Tax=Niallia sp. Krafla_26 TaxID=3064703 RepID=UPI003D17AB33
MYLFVEEKIKKAVDNGEFNDLPGMGKPLDYKDELPGLSPELKLSFKVLKNAGYVTEKEKANHEDITLQDLLTYATEGENKGMYQKRLQFEELAQEKKWHRNSKFRQYVDQIYRKIFQS